MPVHRTLVVIAAVAASAGALSLMHAGQRVVGSAAAGPAPGLAVPMEPGPHGGVVGQVGSEVIELCVRDTTLVVFLLDDKRAPRTIDSGVSARLSLASGALRYPLKLVRVGDHLQGSTAVGLPPAFVAEVSLLRDGRVDTGSITYDRAALGDAGNKTGMPIGDAHMDHTPHHGGIVLMSGDYHFEVVLDPGGRHQIYLADEFRLWLPPDHFGGTLAVRRKGAAAERLPLKAAEDHLVALGKAVAGEAMAHLDLELDNGQTYSIDIPFAAADHAGG